MSMSYFFYVFLSLALILSSPFSFAENLQQIIKLAQTQDATYQAAIHKASSDKENYTQARSRFMPTVSLQYSKTRTKQDVIESCKFIRPEGRLRL